MDRRGIVLENLVGIILAIAGAVLLSFMAAGIYAYIFPQTSLSPNTAGSVEDLVAHVEKWRKDSTDVVSTFLPLEVETDELVVFFGKEDEVAVTLIGSRIPKPQVRQCRVNSCVCGYKDACPKLGELIQARFSSLPLLKCWELRGIDDVLMPKFYNRDYSALGEQDSGIRRMVINVDCQNRRRRTTDTQFNFFFADMVKSGQKGVLVLYQRAFRDELGIEDFEFAFPIIGTCKSGLNYFYVNQLYVERSLLPTGESLLFLTSAFDPTISSRAAVRGRYARYE